MGATSDIVGGSFQITAGPNGVNLGDLIEMGPDGKAYTVTTADYAAVANAMAAVVPVTSVVAGYAANGSGMNYWTPVTIDPSDGSLFIMSPAPGSTGLTLSKFSAAGTLVKTVSVDTSSGTLDCQALARLSNGNFVLVWDTGTGNLKFAIYDRNLNPVVASTVIAGSMQSGFKPVRVQALASGGFAVLFTNGSTTPTVNLAIYTNAGAVTLAVTALGSQSGGQIPIEMGILPNGNIIAAFAGSSSTGAVKYAIYSATGAVVVPTTSIGGASSTGTVYQVLLSILPSGNFCIGYPGTGTTPSLQIQVFNQAGASQGAAVSFGTMAPIGNVLINDGTQFWLFYNWQSLANITSAGVAGGISITQATASAPFGTQGLSAFYENGYLILAGGLNGGTVCRIGVINLTAPLPSAPTANISVGSGNTNNIKVQPAGDFTMLISGDLDTGSAGGETYFAVYKYANTAIEGVCVNAAAAGGQASVQPQRLGGGMFASYTNHVNGTPGKAFNHNSGASPAPNIIGNKGIIYPSGALLQGVQ